MPANLQQGVGALLVAIGAGFLLANLRILWQLLRALRLRSKALLVWPGRQPAYPRLLFGMGLVLAVVICVKIAVLHRPPQEYFGEAMMLLYYVYLVPLNVRIGRGFYEDGLWLDSGFLPYGAIGGLTWREDPQPTLVVLPRMRRLARLLTVPPQHYAEARRLLRDKIHGHDLHFTGKALDLGAHDEREDV
jgi:hypothetical protein